MKIKNFVKENIEVSKKLLPSQLVAEIDSFRDFTADGQLVPTPQEAELQQRQAKEQALLEKEQALLEKERERQAKEKLSQKLRELGIDPDTI